CRAMRSSCRSWRLAGGGYGIVLSLLGVVQGGPPTGDEAAKKAAPPQAAAAKPRQSKDVAASNDLKLMRPRGARQADVSAAETSDGDLLDQVDRQNSLQKGFLRREVRSAIRQASALASTDPAQAENNLKLLADKVSRASELGAEVRAELVEQLQAELRLIRRQAQVESERRLRAQQVAAEGEARERIVRQLASQEQKVDQLMSRYDALVDAQRFRDAEAVAGIAEEIQPGRPGLRGAELTARMTGYTADATAVRDMRHKGFVDVGQQIELSQAPTPDEPPILYPDPESWQLLTERRKKYKAVDLSQHGPNEEKILEALDERTELDFLDQPLEDVMEYLKQRHGIEIQVDNKGLAEAGIGSDTPVTRTLKGITLRSALKLLLGELDLTYVIRNEVLLITSKAEADNMLSMRVYPVADLVVPITQSRGGTMGGGGMLGSSGGMGGMGMGGMGMGGMGMGMGGMPGMGMGGGF
ncbi:MAG: hypothetical protein ACREHD_34665, partial [Pirellulales bacterium]